MIDLGITRALRDFLVRTDALRGPRLGAEASDPTKEDVEFLRGRIDRVLKRSKVATLVVVLVHVLVIASMAAALIGRQDQADVGVAILGGGSVLILGALRALRVIWHESTQLELLLTLASALPPREVLHVVEAYYYNRKSHGASDRE